MSEWAIPKKQRQVTSEYIIVKRSTTFMTLDLADFSADLQRGPEGIWFLGCELNFIKRGKFLAFGGSCLIAARKE